jgi:hypothetical protein
VLPEGVADAAAVLLGGAAGAAVSPQTEDAADTALAEDAVEEGENGLTPPAGEGAEVHSGAGTEARSLAVVKLFPASLARVARLPLAFIRKEPVSRLTAWQEGNVLWGAAAAAVMFMGARIERTAGFDTKLSERAGNLATSTDILISAVLAEAFRDSALAESFTALLDMREEDKVREWQHCKRALDERVTGTTDRSSTGVGLHELGSLPDALLQRAERLAHVCDNREVLAELNRRFTVGA